MQCCVKVDSGRNVVEISSIVLVSVEGKEELENGRI